MSARDELYELAVCGDDRTVNEKIDAYRAEVLREAAERIRARRNAHHDENCVPCVMHSLDADLLDYMATP